MRQWRVLSPWPKAGLIRPFAEAQSADAKLSLKAIASANDGADRGSLRALPKGRTPELRKYRNMHSMFSRRLRQRDRGNQDGRRFTFTVGAFFATTFTTRLSNVKNSAGPLLASSSVNAR